MRRFYVAVLLLVLAFTFGCAQGSGPQTTINDVNHSSSAGNQGGENGGTGTSGVNVEIHIKNFAFDPADITVKQGDTVIWTNEDNVPHSIKGTGFDSPVISSGGRYEHKFTETPGEYAYSCGIHSSMHGKVVVTK